MRKPKSSHQIVPGKRRGERLFEQVSAIPSRVQRRILKPIHAGTGLGMAAVRRTQATTVGSIASFVAVILDLDGSAKSPV
jgi:hypothetical protein